MLALQGHDDLDDELAEPNDATGLWLRLGSGDIRYLRSGTHARSTNGDVIQTPLDRGTYDVVVEDGVSTVVFENVRAIDNC